MAKAMRIKEREKIIYEKYPIEKKELECAREKQRMDELRELLRKRLKEMEKEKREFKGWDFSNDASIR
jgi:hypothetical protein